MKSKSLKFIFIIQGEGRGHMTQAISLFEGLKNAGHEVSHVFIGRSKRRKIPDFVYKRIESPIEGLPSPNFITDKKNKSISVVKTLYYNLIVIKRYLKSLKKIHHKVEEIQPDVIINFYDFLGGFYNAFYTHQAKFICVAHQYLIAHPKFEFPKGRFYEKLLLQLSNWLTSMQAYKKLALSFSDYGGIDIKKIKVVPPLLRSEVKKLSPEKGDFVLTYIVNDGYGKEIREFHEGNPHLKLHCFWDRKGSPEKEEIDEHLTFHQINDQKFLSYMESCLAYASTAGFESICEALYLGKPVMMVPVKKQYEQACNAIDGMRAGAGIISNNFNLNSLLEFIPKYTNTSDHFKEWVDKANEIIVKELES